MSPLVFSVPCDLIACIQLLCHRSITAMLRMRSNKTFITSGMDGILLTSVKVSRKESIDINCAVNQLLSIGAELS